MLRRLVMWACAYWLLDAAALWVFLRAFGGNLSVDGLIVAFGLANVMAAIPITPGRLWALWSGCTSPPWWGLVSREAKPHWAWSATASPSSGCPSCWARCRTSALRLGPFSIDRRDRLALTARCGRVGQAGRRESSARLLGTLQRQGPHRGPCSPDSDPLTPTRPGLPIGIPKADAQ
jgi:putative heme transporter